MDCSRLCGELGVDCIDVADNPTWYTVCGRPHVNYRLYVTATAVICGLAAMLYTLLLTYHVAGGATAAKKRIKRKEM